MELEEINRWSVPREARGIELLTSVSDGTLVWSKIKN